MSRTVMIVDDSLFMRNILRRIIVEKGYSVDSEAASIQKPFTPEKVAEVLQSLED